MGFQKVYWNFKQTYWNFFADIRKVRWLSIFLLLIIASSGNAQVSDYSLMTRLCTERNKNLDPFFKVSSESVPILSVGVPVAMYLGARWKKDENLKSKALEIGTSVIASSFIALSIKYSVQRPRPYETYPQLGAVGTSLTPSFPSAHSANAFALATSLSLTYKKWYVCVPAYAWAGTSAYSRIHLGQHYVSDVLVGSVIGAGSAWISHKLNAWLWKDHRL